MRNRSIVLLIIFCLGNFIVRAEDSTHLIKVHFLYGSVPAKKYKDSEKKWFGGKHGGHVTIEINNYVYGFNPKGKYHVFPQPKNKHGAWAKEHINSFYKDTVGMRYASFSIQINGKEYQELDSILNAWYNIPPRDYSFFGFRCASSTWEALEDIEVLKKHSDLWKAWVIFYPRRIRKRMFKYAERNKWGVHLHEGSERRNWEKDLKKGGF